jgi:hypothetical protein
MKTYVKQYIGILPIIGAGLIGFLFCTIPQVYPAYKVFHMIGWMLIVDSVLFLVGSAWLRPQSIPCWKSMVYLTLIVGISLLFARTPSELRSTFLGTCFLLGWALFSAINAYLWENLFKVTTNRGFWKMSSLEVSILIGFFNVAPCFAFITITKG